MERSWNKLKSIPNYQDVAGELILTRVFQLEGSARTLFGWTQDQDILHDAKFAAHAKTTVNMIDMAVDFLGPDLEPLEMDLMELGKRHVSYGVHPTYLPIMERAVMFALEELLGNSLQRQDRDAWQVVFHFMIFNMQKAMHHADNK